MYRRPALRIVKHGSLWIYRLALLTLVSAVLLVGGTLLAVRYWLLPNIDDYRPRLAQAISRAANQRIEIGDLEAEWHGLRPRLILRDVKVYDAGGVERLTLALVDSTLSWRSLLVLQPRFHSIELTSLSLDVHRDTDGTVRIAGLALRPKGNDSGLVDWLLQQQRIRVVNSELTWIDEQLGAVPLRLTKVQFRVEKYFGGHRFGLRAVPPIEVGAPVDIRGDLKGESMHGLAKLRGGLYLQVGYADLAALRQWLAVPFAISRGAGGVQLWMDINGGRVQSITADVRLSGVLAQLRDDLPPLELDRMQGRLSWMSPPGMEEFAATRLAFTTPDGLQLPQADIRYRRRGAADDPGARYELLFDRLDLEAVTRLLDRLPVEATLRGRLSELQPRGGLRNFNFSWQRSPAGQLQYTMRGNFDDLAVSPSGYLPGFTSVSGTVDADQRGGMLALRAGAAELAMPRVFVEPLPLSSLAAKVVWSMSDGLPLVRVENASFTNAHLSGSLAGTYQAQGEGPGRVHLGGTVNEADGREAWRYVPLVVNDKVRDWLRTALVAGRARDVRFQLHGDLRRFPFIDSADGMFEVVGRMEDGALAYARDWPEVAGIAGQLVFRANTMAIRIDQGRVYGSNLAEGTATIADLKSHDPLLEVRLNAEGPTADMLRFVRDSPVDARIDGFARGVQATGRGRLALALDMPLKRVSDTEVSGTYRFADNVLAPQGAPRLEQVAGELWFTQRDAGVRDGTARVFGVPARFTAERDSAGGVRVQGGGHADVASLRRALALPWLDYLNGATDWRASLLLKAGRYELRLDTDLQGVGSSLPAPLAKPADVALPFAWEMRPTRGGEHIVALHLADVVSAQAVVARTPSVRVVRGEVGLQMEAPLPQRDGLWLRGHTQFLDLDRWRDMLAGWSTPDAQDEPVLAGFDLSADDVYLFSRNWKQATATGQRMDDLWQASVSSREAAGALTWTPGGQGTLTARFSRLYIPAAVAAVATAQGGPMAGAGRDLPHLDVNVEDFRLGERQFGQLQLRAVPEAIRWRIEQLDLHSPEGTLSMTGVWEAWSANPLTHMQVKADVSDIGRYFARLHLPQGIKGGSGRVEGQLAWSGPPYLLDLPSMTGSLRLEASRGQFLKVEPGLGKLIGVVSLQALPRRVTLDFRDVFSQGFPFEEIRSSALIERGVVTTNNFRMVGSAARVDMKGRLDLANETQDLELKVVPSLSESVALGAAIVNPAVGLATLFAQKALKDPINQMASFEYKVTGSWEDPLVTIKKRDAGDDSKRGRK